MTEELKPNISIQELLRVYDSCNGDWCAIAREVESRTIAACQALAAPPASTGVVRDVFEAAVVAHGALFAAGKEKRPDRPALEGIWLAVDAALAAPTHDAAMRADEGGEG